MKKTIFLLTMACALNASGWAATPAVQVKEGRQTIQLSGQGWRLLLDKAAPWKNDHLFPPSEISNVSLLPINMPSGGWQMLNTSQQLVKVPGTVEEFTTSSDTPRVEDYVGVSWWYRDIEVPSDLKGKRVVINFESVRVRAEVYIDGKLVAYDVVGDSPFSADITEAVQGGRKHQLAVRVTNPGGEYHWQDFTTYQWGKYEMPPGRGFGGITGPVSIDITNLQFIEDIYMQNTTEKDSVNAIVTLFNKESGKRNKKVSLSATVIDRRTGDVVWQKDMLLKTLADSTTLQIPVKVAGAKIWNLDSPSLYTCKIELKQGKKLVDNLEQTFGFRSFTVEGIGKDAKLRLNGDRIMLRTAISWGYFPRTGLVPDQAIAEKQIKTAKQLGLTMLNFHRCIGKPIVLDAADSLGLMYFEEPGAWQVCYKSPFTREVLNEKLHRMVKRDRSHPSLIIYGLINEMGGPVTKDTAVMNTRMRDMAAAHAIDPSRMMVLTSGWAGQEFADEDSKAHFRPFDSQLYRRGWWDNHRAGGPMTWEEGFYKSPTDNLMYTTNQTEIFMRGEEGALTSPPRLQKIHDEITRTGRTGWDGKFWEREFRLYKQFFDEKGLAVNFGTPDALSKSMGDISFEHQGRRIQGMRMNNQGDIYAINGWEEMPYDNHSGVVDIYRNPKGNVNTLYRYTQPLYVAVCSRRQIVGNTDSVGVDFYIVNEKNVRGHHTLTMRLLDADGKQIWQQKKSCDIKGGDDFGQLLAENISVVLPGKDGMYRVAASLQDATGKEVTSGYDEILAISDNDALKGKGAIYGFKNDKIAQYYKNVTGKTLPMFSTKTSKLDWLIVNRPYLDEPTFIEDKFFRNMEVSWYADNDFRAAVGKEKDTGVNRSFADGAQPASCVPANQDFSAVWEGELIPDETGLYMIGVSTDRGARLFVNGDHLIDAIRNNGDMNENRPVLLEAGKPAKIRVEYSQTKPTGRLQLRWSRPSASSISMKSVMDRVKNDGTKLIVLGNAESWMKDICDVTGVKYEGYYAVGQNWVGGTHFVRNHPIFASLPTNVGMNWPYQEVVKDGEHRYGFRLHGENLIVGSYKNTPFELGTAVGEIPYGKGKVLFSTLNIIDNLDNPSGPAKVARKLFANYINY